LDKQGVLYKDLGIINYQAAWDYQEKLLQENVQLKLQHTKASSAAINFEPQTSGSLSQISNSRFSINLQAPTIHHLLVCEHPPVYTLGKSGDIKNILISEEEMKQRAIEFYRINRGGDITFHGPEQLVGYPIIDLEKFYTDIGRYLRELEEVIILTIAAFGIKGERSKGETGVWVEPGIAGKERKICAMGVRCSRWITMHGFALNVNTDLSYFDHIIPCGIADKKVTSIEKEIGTKVMMADVKTALKENFEKVFNVNFR
jgi:lipoyl(octanoyl) transferase